ncbi:MAG: hypothetical protein KIT11_06360 [Fimbriimonadaceae bacterium]|nr:hypothetical protein [Fimbriimonadaceae bacterium]QYK55980.1 MAG: hypothetical protein KF733_00550 [Fimbriimonadaceae bacterium]
MAILGFLAFSAVAVSQQQSEMFNPELKAPGQSFTLKGIAGWSQEVSGVMGILIELPARMGVRQHYLFRMTDPKAKDVRAGMEVQVNGQFVAKQYFKEQNTAVYTFDQTKLLSASGQAAPGADQQALSPGGLSTETSMAPAGGRGPSSLHDGSRAAGGEAPEKPKFTDQLKGWAFRGTVRSEHGVTAVFVNAARTRYVQVGGKIEDDLFVVGLNSDRVQVKGPAGRFDLTPW